jgi:hypothetical protein
MGNPPPGPEDFDEELIRSEFESMVSGLSLDESTPNSYLDELDRFEQSNHFIAPNPPSQSPRAMWRSMKRAFRRWFNQDYKDDDGAIV